MNVLAAYRRLLRNTALTRLLVGEFVSSIGDWLYLVALLVVVYAESGSPVLLGVIGAARIVPYIVLSVPAGVLVDRFDRRWILIVTDLARGAVMLAMAAAIALDAPLAIIVALALLAACFSTFFGPAIGAFLPSLVDESELGPANSAWATLDNLAFVLGPAIAGLLIGAGGLTLAFLLNAASFGVVAMVLWRLPASRAQAAVSSASAAPPSGAPGAVTPGQPGGLGAAGMLRPLAGLTVINVVTGFVFGGLGVLTVIIADEVLGESAATTGYLNAAIGVGGVLGGLASAALVLRPRLAPPLLVGGALLGIGLFALGQTASLLPALATMAIASAGSLLVEVVGRTVFQRAVPDALRGRAFGAMETAGVTAYAGGSFLLPVLAGSIGVGLLLGISGVAVVVACVIGVALVGASASGPAVADPLRARLLRMPIFAGLPPARLEAAAGRLVQVPVRKGEVVIRQGEPADRFYLIVSGRYAVTQKGPRGRPRRLRVMPPGDFFGEIGLLTGSPRTASVSALDVGLLLGLDGPSFLELVGSGPGLTSRLLDLHRGATPARGG